MVKKKRKIFITQIWQFIHQSKAYVGYIHFMLFLNMLVVKPSPKIPKIEVGLLIFKGRLKKLKIDFLDDESEYFQTFSTR